MKIIPEIIVTNPNDVSKGCQDFANKILAVVQQRVLVDSKTYKNIEANLYIYIGINVNVNKELLKPINENFYYGSAQLLNTEEFYSLLFEFSNKTLYLNHKNTYLCQNNLSSLIC